MQLKRLSRAAISGPCLLMLACSLAFASEPQCFSGSNDTGRLTFSGAVEGTGFNGGFGEFTVDYCMPASGPENGQVDVRIALASADTENRERDETLKGEEFFAVDQFPHASWSSRSISVEDDGYAADGELELKGIRASQAVRFTLAPDGDDLIARGEFSMRGEAAVERLRFDVGTGEFADPEFVRNRVDVSFEIRLVARD